MKTFNVTLQHGRTDTFDVVADSLLDVQSLYAQLSESDIRVIKEQEYFNPVPQKPVTNAYRELKLLISDGDHRSNFLTVPFMRPVLTKDRIIKAAKELLLIHDKPVSHVMNIIRHT